MDGNGSRHSQPHTPPPSTPSILHLKRDHFTATTQRSQRKNMDMEMTGRRPVHHSRRSFASTAARNYCLGIPLYADNTGPTYPYLPDGYLRDLCVFAVQFRRFCRNSQRKGNSTAGLRPVIRSAAAWPE